MGFAIAGEDFRNRHAGGVFNFRVGITKRQAQERGNPSPKRGFPRPRQPDQHNAGPGRIAWPGGFRQAWKGIIK